MIGTCCISRQVPAERYLINILKVKYENYRLDLKLCKINNSAPNYFSIVFHASFQEFALNVIQFQHSNRIHQAHIIFLAIYS